MHKRFKLAGILILSAMMGWFSGNLTGHVGLHETVTVYRNDSEEMALGLPFRRSKT